MGLESGIPRSQNAYEPYDKGVPSGAGRLPPSGGITAGGALSGLGAGLAMWLALMFWSASMGQGFWTPLQLAAGTFLGARALLDGAGSAALGAVVALAVAGFWGVLFAAVVGGDMKPGPAFWAGLSYGVSVWALMTWLVLPALDRTLLARVGLMQVPWAVCHLIYGGALLYTPALRRRFSERPLSPQVRPPARSGGPRSASRTSW